MSTASRSETNREIRRILVRNGVDTSKVQFSCSGRTIMLSGALYRDGGEDLAQVNIESICQAIARMGMSLFCELDNWSISDGSITKKGPKGGHQHPHPQAAGAPESKKVS